MPYCVRAAPSRRGWSRRRSPAAAAISAWVPTSLRPSSSPAPSSASDTPVRQVGEGEPDVVDVGVATGGTRRPAGAPRRRRGRRWSPAGPRRCSPGSARANAAVGGLFLGDEDREVADRHQDDVGVTAGVVDDPVGERVGDDVACRAGRRTVRRGCSPRPPGRRSSSTRRSGCPASLAGATCSSICGQRRRRRWRCSRRRRRSPAGTRCRARRSRR